MNELSFGDMNDILEGLSPEQQYQEMILKAIETSRIYANQDILPPQPLFSIGESVIMRLGGVSMSTGKAKSRKSFLMTIFTSIFLSGEENFGIKTHRYSNRKRMILFDTEQSRFDTQKNIIRATELAWTNGHDNIEVHSLRAFNTHDRRNIISTIIDDLNDKNDIALVIIDGIRDIITSINDEEQATEVATWLLNITAKKDLHVHCILHQNKSLTDKSARGWIGSELTNKSECVISVEKIANETETSIVKCEQIRGSIEFEPFAFKINEKGLPYQVPLEKKQDGRQSKITPLSIDMAIHLEIADRIYKNRPEGLGHSELWNTIQTEFERMNPAKRPSNAKAIEIMNYWKTESIIVHNEKNKRDESKWLRNTKKETV